MDKRDIVISFDDGYKNVINAINILLDLKIPAIFSISTSRVEKDCFWSDSIEKAIRFTKKIRLIFPVLILIYQPIRRE
ncbi:MAG: hypothetical protein ACTSVV_18390 [Promethearchaeota archaeon]